MVRYLYCLLDIGFSFGIVLFFKDKLLEGGFGLWLGENISILSMVKRAHLVFIIGYGSTLSLDSLITGR